jgi:hypothetical protein
MNELLGIFKIQIIIKICHDHLLGKEAFTYFRTDPVWSFNNLSGKDVSG